LVDSRRDARIKLVQAKIVPVTASPTLIHALIWGRVKSGKTAFACTGPNPIVLEAEKGTMTVRRQKNVQVYPRKADGGYRPLRWKDTYDFLYYLRYADHDRGTTVIDTMSALVRVGMRYINKDEEARDDARPPGLTDQRTWGRLANLVTEFMEELEEVCQTRGMHLIYTAQERTLKEEQAEQLGVDKVPDFTPAIRSFVTEKPSILARTFMEDEEGEEIDKEVEGMRYGMTFRDPDLLVGERVTPLGAKEPWLPRHAYNVTIPKIIKRIERKETSG
jgi:hypothetical protein